MARLTTTVTFTPVIDSVASHVKAFVDNGYLIALEDADDENHLRALKHWEGLARVPALTTTSYVLDEVVTFFNVRDQHAKAVELSEMLLESTSVRMIHVEEELLKSGLALLRSRPDKRYSLTDCVSFALMREHEIHVAFAFDRHFEQEGFVSEPPKPGTTG
jgi:uncharacterized protein